MIAICCSPSFCPVERLIGDRREVARVADEQIFFFGKKWRRLVATDQRSAQHPFMQASTILQDIGRYWLLSLKSTSLFVLH